MTTIDLATLRVIITAEDRQYSRGVRRARRQSKDFSADIKKFVAGAAAAAFAVATKAVVDFTRQSLDEFKAFEAGISEVFTLVPDMSEAALGEIEAQAIQAGIEMGRLSDDVVPALYQSLSAGVPPDNVFEFLETANAAALGGVTELAVAVDGITSATNAYGLEVLSAAEASDLMFTAVKGGKTTFGELSSSLFQVIPTASALDVEFGNVTASMAAITSQGVPTRVAATQLRQALIEMSKAGGETAMLFEDLAGKSFREFIAEGGNVQQALQVLERHADSLDIGINDLFGSVEAGNAALALTGSGTEKFAAELMATESAAGATDQAADVMRGTVQHLENSVAAATEALKIHVGEGLEPAKSAWLEFQLAILQGANAHIEQTRQAEVAADGWITLQQQILRNADATGEYVSETGEASLTTNELLTAIGILNEELGANTFGLDESTRRTEILASMQQLLESGYQGTAEELVDLATKTADVNLNIAAQTEEFAGLAEQLQETEDFLAGQAEAMDALAAAELAEAEAREFRIAVAQDDIEISQQISITAEDIATAEAEREAATLAAAEAERVATEAAEDHAAALAAEAAALAASQAALGGYFQAALAGTLHSEGLEQALFNTAGAAGASATELGGLGVALGLFDEQAAESMVRSALLQASLDNIAAAFAAGELSAFEARDAFMAAQEEVDNMAFSFDAASGNMRESFQPATAETVAALAAMTGEATAAGDAIDDIPRSVDVDINLNTNGQLPPLPGSGDPGNSNLFMGGGFTGDIPADQVAGLVHGREFVFNAAATARIGRPALEALHNGGSLGGLGGGTTVNVPVTVNGNGDPLEIERAVRRAVAVALAEAGEQSETLIRMR